MRETKRAKGAKRATASGGRFVAKGARNARVPSGTVVAAPTAASGRQRRVAKIVGEYRETFRALAKK